MRRLIFSVLFTCFGTMIFAQDLKTAKSYLDKKQLDKAKSEIDSYVAKTPADAEGYYMKAKIYEQIAAGDSGQAKIQEANDVRQQAFEAFKKAMADTTNPKMTLLALKDQYQPVISLYSDYYGAGAAAFNAAAPAGDKAGFENAMNSFIKADDIGHYIGEHKWARIPDVDTTLVLNIGKAAINAGKNDVASTYFRKLADAGITGTKDGGENNATFVLPYEWLTLNYKNAKDEANMMKYSNLGKKYYPNDDNFDLYLLEYYRDKKDNPALFAKYDEIVAKHPDSLVYHFNYATEIFRYLYNSDEGTVINDKENLLKKLGEQIEAAYKINPNYVDNNWLYAQYYYNLGVESRDQALKVKGTKPEDVKKKADFNAESKANYNKAIPYGEKAISTLETGHKKSDKSRYKSIVDIMQKTYQNLNQNDKVKMYQDKYDAADGKFVN